MKILYLCADSGIPVRGRKGASVHVRELIGAFARAGHRITLAAPTLVKSSGDEPARIRARVIQVQPDAVANAAVHALRDFNERLNLENALPAEVRRVLYNETLYQELKRRFLQHPPAFIYERASLYGTAGIRLAGKFKVPLILELNAPLVLEQSAYRGAGFGDLAVQAEKWSLTQADAVVAVSSELARHARSVGAKASRIHVIPNGVNPELFTEREPGEPRRHFLCRSGQGSAPRPPLLGFVGGLRPWHGVEVLPELLARLSGRHPGIRLVIAGDGQLRAELEREFRKRGLAKSVTFTGALAHEEVPAIIRQFDIALAPYPRHHHDFYFSPLKVYEYMACGVPVVASRQGQVAEVVQHGRTGLLYPAGNLRALEQSCERLLRDEPLRQRMGTAAAKVVHARFTWDHNVARVVALAKRLRR